jgi:perosamine synthetase
MTPIPHSRPTIGDEDIVRVCAQLRGGMLAEGETCAAVERQLAARWGASHATLAGSGTQALVLALLALGTGPGSEVLCPSYVCPEVLAAVESLGATLALVDTGPDYFPVPESVRAARTQRTVALVVPYLMGLCAPLTGIRALGIPIVADCAQFFPSPDAVARVDADLIVLSFEATKLLTSGEGGAVLTDDAGHAARVADRKRLDRGPYKRNLYPLSDLQAALLAAQLARIDQFLSRRREIAARYRAGLLKSPRVVEPGWSAPYSCFFRYPLRVKDAPDGLLDGLIDYCGVRGVAVRRPVDTLLHRLRGQRTACPGAELAFRETLSLPIYPSLEDPAQDFVIGTVNAACESFGLAPAGR